MVRDELPLYHAARPVLPAIQATLPQLLGRIQNSGSGTTPGPLLILQVSDLLCPSKAVPLIVLAHEGESKLQGRFEGYAESRDPGPVLSTPLELQQHHMVAREAVDQAPAGRQTECVRSVLDNKLMFHNVKH